MHLSPCPFQVTSQPWQFNTKHSLSACKKCTVLWKVFFQKQQHRHENWNIHSICIFENKWELIVPGILLFKFMAPLSALCLYLCFLHPQAPFEVAPTPWGVCSGRERGRKLSRRLFSWASAWRACAHPRGRAIFLLKLKDSTVASFD